MFYGLSKQRIDTRLPAWAGSFESGKYLGIDTHVQRGSLLRKRWATAAKLFLALKQGGAIEERFVEFWHIVWINPAGLRSGLVLAHWLSSWR